MKKLNLLCFGLILLLYASFTTNAYAQECSQLTNTPDLYQVTKTNTQAVLYFTPVTGATRYNIVYGLEPGNEKYSVTFNYGTSTGAISYTINDLDPKLNYSFRVNGQNDCSTSPWSKWVGKLNPTPTIIKPKSGSIEAGSESGIILLAVSLGTIAVGATLFKLSSKKAD